LPLVIVSFDGLYGLIEVFEAKTIG
jgi:hypothetical protein